MQIHQSAEDYLETILMLTQRMGRVRSIDVVNELGFTKASVSIAMKKLRENGYIAVDGEGNLTLLAGGVLLLAGVFVCGGRAGAYMDGGRPQAGAQRRTGDTAFAGAADGAGRKRLLLSGRRGAAGQHPVLGAKLVGLAYLAAAFLRCSWTLSHWKQETPKEELKTLLLLALAPAAGFLLQGWLPGRGLLCCGITLGLVCVYVLVLQTKFTVDTLTGVSNRIVALRYLESELPYYRRHPNRSLHFLMMDMDHFKHINDQYGHLEGDAALVLLAGILKKVCANYNGVLARYGGDEFCIACGCNSVEVRTLIASIQRELDAANAASGKPYQIEISIGCARLEPDIATVHDLIDKADQEMYHLKTRKHGTAPAEKTGLNSCELTITR